jgi:hypothetical protein
MYHGSEYYCVEYNDCLVLSLNISSFVVHAVTYMEMLAMIDTRAGIAYLH